jgi:ligand-binding sensor domain-containing protein
MEVVHSESGHLLVGATNGGIWETTDSGKRWESIREQLTIGAITSIVTPNDRRHRIIVGTSQDGLAEYEPGRLP